LQYFSTKPFNRNGQQRHALGSTVKPNPTTNHSTTVTHIEKSITVPRSKNGQIFRNLGSTKGL
jgi:hypothetical protein